MLSFMRDQGGGEPSTRQSKGSEPQGGHTSDDGAQEFLTVATNRSKLRKSTILVTILVAIGRLTGVSTEMVDKMDRIVKKFYEFSDVFQVQVNELVKDPFEAQVFAKEIEQEVLASDDVGVQAALIRKQRARERADTLEFLSVMESDKGNACMINDRILQEGDEIKGFLIKRIGSDFIDLLWRDDSGPGAAGSETEDLTIHLKLSQ